MRHSFVSRWFLAGAILVLAQTVHCGDDHANSEVVFDGTASDEAYVRVSERIASAMVSMTSAAQMTAPMNGASVPSSQRPTFSWSLPNARGVPAPGGAPQKHAAISFAVQEALAHGPPTTGDVFLLEISTSASNTVKVFTKQTSWQIDDANWSKLKAGGSAATIKIYNAFVNNNVIEEGPFTPPSPTTFTIAP